VDSQFAIVELMGHQRFGAKVRESELCGTKLLHCEVLTDPPYEREVHPQAIYAINRCTEERARLECRYLRNPVLMPAPTTHGELPGPYDIPFGDPEEQEHPDACDDAEGDWREFKCERCKISLTDRLDEEICIPEHWEAIPFGWSVLTDDEADTVSRFCSTECVRGFLNGTTVGDPGGARESQRGSDG